MKLMELTKVECDFLLKLLAEWSREPKADLESLDASLALSLAERIEETEDD